MNVYSIAAVAALALHLFWILWILLGWLVTRHRPLLRWVHIGSLVYAILLEIFLWPCPLTLVEQWAETRAGLSSYREAFLVHYLQGLIYPNVSQAVVTGVSVAVCLFILGVHGWRWRQEWTGEKRAGK